jgi:hypothetical protein
MTSVSDAGQRDARVTRPAMRFSVDGWDPSYGASLELEGQLEKSTATIEADVELPSARWRPVDPDDTGSLPEALLFVDGVQRVEARVWVDGDAVAADPSTGEIQAGEATAALCASYAAGVVCCCAAGAHLVVAKVERGLFSVAPHASDILTSAGQYKAHHVALKRTDTPVTAALSQSLQVRMAQVEEEASRAARSPQDAVGALPAGHKTDGPSDLLIVDGPLRNRQHLPRALGYIKSHNKTYLPPELNALVGRLAAGQRTPVFRLSATAFRRDNSLERYSWYLRLPGPAGAPWSGVVRIETAALGVDEVVGLAALSQRCLGRFASAAYKDSRAPQNLYPIAGLERELRRRLGDPQVLYRALRAAARQDGPPSPAG